LYNEAKFCYKRSGFVDTLDFKVALEKTVEQIGEGGLAALAACRENMPTARTMSVVLYNKESPEQAPGY
jgi:hypothetical protein